MLHSTIFSQESAQKHLPTFGKKRPSYPTPPPRFQILAAHRIAVNAHLACAHTRAPQSVFVFGLHPSRRGLSSLIVRALGVKTPPIFVLHRSSRRVQPG